MSGKKRDIVDHELFDISDVTFDMRPSKTRNEVTLKLNGDRPFSLMRYYLSLKQHVEQIELGLNISDADDGDH